MAVPIDWTRGLDGCEAAGLVESFKWSNERQGNVEARSGTRGHWPGADGCRPGAHPFEVRPVMTESGGQNVHPGPSSLLDEPLQAPAVSFATGDPVLPMAVCN
jgi:hypothetical protein